jgi:hypothetical protein
MDNINVLKLHKEIESAGIKLCGCSSSGVVWDINNNEIQDRPDVLEVILNHDPTPIHVETIEEMIDRKISEAISPAS